MELLESLLNFFQILKLKLIASDLDQNQSLVH